MVQIRNNIPRSLSLYFAFHVAVVDLDIGSDGEEKINESDLLESIHECLYCSRPLVCASSQLIKVCARPRCRFGKNQLKNKPKVVVDREVVAKWFKDQESSESAESDNEVVDKFLEDERQRKKREYFQRLKPGVNPNAVETMTSLEIETRNLAVHKGQSKAGSKDRGGRSSSSSGIYDMIEKNRLRLQQLDDATDAEDDDTVQISSR